MHSIEQYVMNSAPLAPNECVELMRQPEVFLEGIGAAEQQVVAKYGESIDAAPEAARLAALQQLALRSISYANREGYTGSVSSTLESLHGQHQVHRNRSETSY